MATLTHAQSRRLYSWWWDSHISPKNSKWLQDNLADIDAKVRAMIRLIEEDAESFAQRAEMFYKNRPELMKLVEEFYRAYRAMAERYDHATGALRQAHRKMAEAFPNEIPLEFPDEASGLSASDEEPQDPNMTSALFDTDSLQNDFILLPLHYDATKMGKACLQEIDEPTCKISLKEVNGMGIGSKFNEGKVTRLNSQEEQGKCSEYKLLQKEISLLSKENQDLNNQIDLESVRADKAEFEVQRLKEIFAKVNIDKEAALSRYKESLSRVSYLENEISHTQAEIKKLNNEMLAGVKCLNSAEERSLALEKANHSLNLELDMLKQRIREQKEEILMLEKANQSMTLELEMLKQRIREQQEELDMKSEELERLKISLKEECLGKKLAEMTCHSMEKQLAECQEKEKILAAKLKSEDEKMEDIRFHKVNLEEELQKARLENGMLNEQKLSSAFEIISLQNKIISLTDSKVRLEDELERHVKEKTSLQHKLSRLKEDRNDLEERYNALREEIQAVNSNIQSLLTMIKDLRDGNIELKETLKKYEDEKDKLENLNHTGALSKKNAISETSIADGNVELEKSREKIQMLEQSCYHLHGRISIHQAEKALLISQSESVSLRMETLSKKNIFLENSLSDMNFELDGLRGKLKSLEESCKSLHDEKSSLLSENVTLFSRVENISRSLEILEGRYAQLESKHSNLEREKNSTLKQVAELRKLLRLEKEVQSNLIQSSKTQRNTLSNKIFLLQEEGQKRKEEIEVEQMKIMNAQMEIFILQSCLHDLKEENLTFSVGSQKHQETLKQTEKVILELEQECLIQEKKIKSLTEDNKKLREWIHLILKLLKIDLEHAPLDDINDEFLLQLILREIRHLLQAISEAQDEKHHLFLEKSLVITLLEQFGMYAADLRTEKTTLAKENTNRTEELTKLKNENHELLIKNEHLRLDVQASNQREEALKVEVDILFVQLSSLQEAHCSLQLEYSKMIEEKLFMSKTLQHLRYNQDKLEEENNIILAEAVASDCLLVMLKNCIAERGFELQLLNSERNYLFKARNDLDKEIKLIHEKIVELEAENNHIKESVPELREKCNLASLELKKDMELSQANWNFQTAENTKAILPRNLYGLKLDLNATKVTKEEVEKTNSILLADYACKGTEVAYVHDKTEMLRGELSVFPREAEDLRSIVQGSTLEVQIKNNDVKFSDAKVSSLLNDIQFTTNNAEQFRAQVHELMQPFQSFKRNDMVQRNIVQEEIMIRDLTLNQLNAKLIVLEGENRGLTTDLNAYLQLLRSLWDDFSILEEHTMSLARHRLTPNHQNKEDVEVKFSTKRSQEPSEDYPAASPGLLNLQILHAKLKELQKVVIDTGSILELERLDSNASLEAALKEIEGLTPRRIRDKQRKRFNQQIRKDLQLDISLDSSRYGDAVLSHGPRKTGNTESISDLVIESCGTTKVGSSNSKQKGPLVAKEKDVAHCQSEKLDESGYPLLELVVEKELGVDKLVLPKKLEENKEWNTIVMERLTSDCKRLLNLQASVMELQKSILSFENVNNPTEVELDHFKFQLKDTEETISKLIDINSKLAKKVDDFSMFPDNQAKEKKDSGRRSQQISDRATKVSEKIGKLELEIQNIRYTLLKAEEEYTVSRTKIVDKRSGILLKEFIYGKRDSRRQKKKASSCNCMRPKAKGD